MKAHLIKVVLSILFTTTFTACKEVESTNSTESSMPLLASSNGLLLSKATQAEIDDSMIKCHHKRHGAKTRCVPVCHMPPGNPLNMKTLYLPESAIGAHKNHGGKHHEDHDYIGACGNTDNNDDSSSDDNNSSYVYQQGGHHHGNHGRKCPNSGSHSDDDDDDSYDNSSDDSTTDDSTDDNYIPDPVIDPNDPSNF